jgi:hypothetical protein
LIQPAILIDERLKYETNLIAPSVCDIFKSNLVCSEQPAKELDKNKSKGTANSKIVPACEQIEKDVDLEIIDQNELFDNCFETNCGTSAIVNDVIRVNNNFKKKRKRLFVVNEAPSTKNCKAKSSVNE